MARRIARIYPAFIVVFAAYLILSFAFPSENKIPTDATEGMIYLAQNFLLLPGIFPIDPMITVAWSLSYEMFYYLAIPLFIFLFGLRERSSAWRVIFFLSLALSITAYCAFYGGHVRLIMFIAGISLYESVNGLRVQPLPSYMGLLALFGGLLSTFIPIAGSEGIAIKASILFVSFYALCLTCFNSPSEWLSRAFSWTPLRYLGNMSYSYYLIHGLALKAGFLILAKLFPASYYGDWLFWLMLPTMFTLTLLPATTLFLLIERPFSLTKNQAIPSKIIVTP